MNLKTKILTTILIFLYLFIFSVMDIVAQNTALNVSGHVIDETTGNPVTNHLVLITVTGAGVFENYEFYTNDAGFYGNDLIPAPSQGLVRAGTFDCIGEEHTQEEYFNPNNTTFIFDFEICSDSIPSGDCENWFFFDTWNFTDFTFIGQAEPLANIYSWDFGDGFSGTGEIVSHSYDTTINDIVVVSLTTIYIDPSTGDSCFAYSNQEVWVGYNGGDCQADFVYTADSIPAGGYLAQFTDLSIGEPTYWLWDFGDGEFSEEQNPEHIYLYPGTYFVCLTIISDTTNCYDMYCEVIVLGPGGSGDCENWFWYETNDNVTFNFGGESFPFPADEWLWDFGDGETAYGQQVSHTFNPNQGTMFNVSLFTLTYDPIFGDSCVAVSDQWVFVGDSMNCQAGFYYEPDNEDELTINFFDSSSGLITSRLWDFGDGTYSEETNPSHLFPGPGNYTVCLSVFSDTVGFYCFDTVCSNVVIDYAFSADFSFNLDTISGQTNNYYFTDISIGNADTWLWGFGDGNVSAMQNPTYQFSESGTYEVCLEISKTFLNNVTYTDTYCQTIETPNYYDFGGQAFIDGFPLNNNNGDTTIVDTGIAYLYKKYNNTLIPVDTNFFYNYGYYWFTQIREGDYLVKLGLTENSLNYNNVAVSYHENALHWNQADILNLHDTNYYVHVNMVDLQGIDLGPGSISGYLTVSDIDFLNPLLVSEIEILLLDNNGLPLTFTITDGQGNFHFNNIPLGSYKLAAEATGFISFEVAVTLDENNQTVTDINLELYEASVGIENNTETLTNIGTIYPNPVSNNFNLDIELDNYSELIIEIYTILGQKISSTKHQLSNGRHTLSFNSSAFQNGVYILSISTAGNTFVETRKFVK